MLLSEGTLNDGTVITMSEAELLEAYRWMLMSRAFDEKAFSLQRQGRLGTYAPGLGQEAVSVGVSMSLRPDHDWIVPQYRELVPLLRHGWSLRDALLFFRGHPDGWRTPARTLPIQIALAAQLPHAVGLAWGLKQRGSDAVVVTFCGEGASSEGDFHEALNFAGVLRVPLVVVLVDNNWAISTPRSLQTAAPNFAVRAPGYGLAGEHVDGNDLLAVHRAATAAVERARAGGGTTLIEATTYRLMPHNTIDDASRYVDPQDLADAEEREPLRRVRTYLKSVDLLTDAAELALGTAIEQEIDSAVEEADRYAAPESSELFAHVYSAAPRRLRRQLAALDGDGGPA